MAIVTKEGFLTCYHSWSAYDWSNFTNNTQLQVYPSILPVQEKCLASLLPERDVRCLKCKYANL